MWVGGTVEKPTERVAFDLDKLRIRIGDRVYYPAGVGGAGREVVAMHDAPLRRWAALGSAQVGSAEKDATHTALYWCDGDELDGEDIWWLIQTDDTDPDDVIGTAPRLHVTHTFQRPEQVSEGEVMCLNVPGVFVP